MKLEEVAKVLNEYGAAIRGDWGSIDGRCEQGTIDTFAQAMLTPDLFTATLLRGIADICPDGGGHWTDHCSDSCAEASA